MKNKGIFALNLLLAVLVQASMIWYLDCGGLWRKGLTSFGFVLLGVLNLAYLIAVRRKPFRFLGILVIGLVFAMLGDIVLNVNFIGGALLFAVGHIFYAISYAQLQRIGKLDLLLSGVIFAAAALFLLLAPIFDFGDAVMKGICVGYALIISLMFSKAVSNYRRNKCRAYALMALGSAMFVFSDFMLLLDVFANGPAITDTLCVMTYFPGQCIQAHALYWLAEKK